MTSAPGNGISIRAGLPMLSSREVFVLDWDGTLFDSMAIKFQSFARVAAEYLAEAGAATTTELAAEIYRANSGKPRREIFSIVGKARGIDLSESDFSIMSDRLTALNFRLLADAPVFADAMALLSHLVLYGRTPCVSSSVPQNELDHFVSRKIPRELRAHFGGVFGSAAGFSKGCAHLKRIMADNDVATERILAIGDDEADYELSTAAGVDCIIVNRADRVFPPRIPTVSALTELCDRIN